MPKFEKASPSKNIEKGEGMFFKSARPRLEKIDQNQKKIKWPDYAVAAGREEKEFYQPLQLTDYLLELRKKIQSIQGDNPAIKEAEQATTKRLQELISPELLVDFEAIRKQLRDKALKYEGHTKREYIDLEDPALTGQVESWCEKLINKLRQEKEVVSPEDVQEIEANVWLLFNSMADAINTNH